MQYVENRYRTHDAVDRSFYDAIKFSCIKILSTVEFGTVLVIEEIWEQCGIGSTLREVIGKKQLIYDKALLAMVANLLCISGSKLGVWDRWLETVYLPGYANPSGCAICTKPWTCFMRMRRRWKNRCSLRWPAITE